MGGLGSPAGGEERRGGGGEKILVEVGLVAPPLLLLLTFSRVASCRVALETMSPRRKKRGRGGNEMVGLGWVRAAGRSPTTSAPTAACKTKKKPEYSFIKLTDLRLFILE